jgi:hypothetical protein
MSSRAVEGICKQDALNVFLPGLLCQQVKEYSGDFWRFLTSLAKLSTGANCESLNGHGRKYTLLNGFIF